MWSSHRYTYPTREAYRFHFKEPPAAPITHEENTPKPGRKSVDFKKAMMSERAELDHIASMDLVRKDAPFGTNDTPTITMKIIGGRQVPVIEKHANYNNDYGGSRIHPLQPIADKPNHMDPRTYGDLPGGYYKDVQDLESPREALNPPEPRSNDLDWFYEEFGDLPTTLAHRRPDSKDISTRHVKALPPIQQNRSRIEMSTVFEAEPWTQNKKPSLARETEYKQNYATEGEDMNGFDNYVTSPRDSNLHVTDAERNNLAMLVPRNVLLPVDPIKLSREQELTLCKMICADLRGFDPVVLRDVYLAASQHDRDLNGLCSIEVLDNCLRQYKADLSDNLRFIAAQFVDPHGKGKVNYEKVLSFIGSALQMGAKGQFDERPQYKPDIRAADNKPRYYLDSGESKVETGSIYRDREVAKLLRIVERELSKTTYSMDWTSWQNRFYKMDRDHRETLSAAQIKDICYDERLPLSDSIINRILSLCEKDGQYKWQSFMDFLSRVRPSNTGLPIPVSKRPLEYAKHYPEPVPNWPKQENDMYEQDRASPRRDYEPRRDHDQRRSYEQRRDPSPQRQDRYNDRDAIPVQNVIQSKEQISKDVPQPDNRDRYSPDRNRRPRSRDSNPAYQRRDHTPPRQEIDRYSLHRHENYSPYQPDRYSPTHQRRNISPEDTGERFNNHREYRDRSYRDEQRGYTPSWQHTSPKRSTSPPPARRINEPTYRPGNRDRDENYRRSDNEEIDRYERQMRYWAHNARDYRARSRGRPNRPLSYAEPSRVKQGHEDNGQRSRPLSYRDDIRLYDPSFHQRINTSLRRHQSLPPIRYHTPQFGHPSQYPYKEYHRQPMTDRPMLEPPIREHPTEQPLPDRQLIREQPIKEHYFRNQPIREHRPQEQPIREQVWEQPIAKQTIREVSAKEQNAYVHNDRFQYNQNQYYRNGDRTDRGGYTPRDNNGQTSQRMNREDQIRNLSNQLKDIETKYQVTRDGMHSTELPWLDRYLKLARALYKSDVSNKGSLPRKDVMDLVRQYNEAFNLNLDLTKSNMLALSPENLDKSGNIMLRPFLANLSSDNKYPNI